MTPYQRAKTLRLNVNDSFTVNYEKITIITFLVGFDETMVCYAINNGEKVFTLEENTFRMRYLL